MSKPFVDLGRLPQEGAASPIGAPSKVPLALMFDPAAQVDTDELLARGLITPEQKAHMEAEDAELRKRLSPPGALGLPPLLEERRLKLGIVDEVFTKAGVATFERVFVLPLPRFVGDTLGPHSNIIIPAATARREGILAPRGVLISAGPQALNALHTNGLEVGDIVSFMHSSPWSIPITWARGEEVRLQVMNVGDIVSSEDLQQRMLRGEVTYEWNAEEGRYYLVHNAQGGRWLPVHPRPDFLQ